MHVGNTSDNLSARMQARKQTHAHNMLGNSDTTKTVCRFRVYHACVRVYYARVGNCCEDLFSPGIPGNPPRERVDSSALALVNFLPGYRTLLRCMITWPVSVSVAISIGSSIEASIIAPGHAMIDNE